MSRRRVSVKELGAADCQGWLHRRKEGRGFLGSRWKRYWFILKKSSLYWYTDKTAEKAEGFINLNDFTIEPASECRRKHALKASHPQVVTLFMAADGVTDIVMQIEKMTLDSWISSSYFFSSDKTSDEMERLYVHLKQASLSPIGQHKPSNQRDFRASFVRRCRDDKINEKLHVARILNSTLKAKEAELLGVEQILADATLSAPQFREWKLSNFILLQDIRRRRAPTGGAAAPRDRAAAAAEPGEAESSL
uniref:Interaction protein for cytohesin exchange factors 1 n=1 Tax=Myripristis murdjan TaxID=586833 RepID=A0A667Y7G0_9TELE